jgi:hypothetical protein
MRFNDDGMPSGFPVMLAALGVTLCLAGPSAEAASHREAPLTALDHKADIADFYAFVSYDDPGKVTFIMTVDPLLEPANGPNYFPFDPGIRYRINIDNNHDAVPDLSFEFRFETEIRLPGVFTGFVGAGDGIPAPSNSPPPVAPGTPLVPPAITALDGPGSEGLSLRQRYEVRLVRPGFAGRPVLQSLSDGEPLYAVPSNVGPRTMPDYPALADQGIYDLGDGIRVFAGTVEDPFWIDLGAAFDSLNFRPDAFATGVAGVLSDEQDDMDDINFAPDAVSGFNVNAIAIEVPIAMVTRDDRFHDADDPRATIGSWATTSRPRVRILRDPSRTRPARPFGLMETTAMETSGPLVQIQRLGNPLINELLIGTGDKDLFSMSQPRDDSQFADYFLDPLLARVLNAVYDTTVSTGVLPIPDPPRTDLLPLVQYRPPIAAEGTPTGPVADLLRLNTGVPSTPVGMQSRLGLLGGDPAGFPNGRRPVDDVTDIAARVVAGVLAGPPFDGFPHGNIGDGVNTNDADYRETFPYLGHAHSGRDRRHVDSGEPGCTGTCP